MKCNKVLGKIHFLNWMLSVTNVGFFGQEESKHLR